MVTQRKTVNTHTHVFLQKAKNENDEVDFALTSATSDTKKAIDREDESTSNDILPKTNYSQASTPTPELMMKALNTSPRRIFLSTLTSSGIALVSNFCGITSKILENTSENLVEQSGLDLIYPRGAMKRFKSGEYKYSFVIPKEWVQDTAVELAKIQNRSARLDYSMKRTSNGSIPDVAYGPPGYFNERGISQSDTNVSTIVSKVKPGFTLQSLGNPTQAAEFLLKYSIAPEGSGKIATLLAANEEIRGQSKVYQFEYTLDRGNKGDPLRAASAIAVSNNGNLVTLTVVSLEKEWENPLLEAKLTKIAQSFKLIQ
jgi:hypothetical protein